MICDHSISGATDDKFKDFPLFSDLINLMLFNFFLNIFHEMVYSRIFVCKLTKLLTIFHNNTHLKLMCLLRHVHAMDKVMDVGLHYVFK